MKYVFHCQLIIILIIVPCLCGCSLLRDYKEYCVCGKHKQHNNGSHWGEGVTVFPETKYKDDIKERKKDIRKSIKKSFKEIGKNALCSILDPVVLIPAVGGALLAIDNWDEEISDWAADHNPIFGSKSNARDTSDALLGGLVLETVGTLLLTKSGDNEYWKNKGKGAAVEFGALGVELGVTQGLKEAVGRERPNRKNDRSFPSGHSSHAFSLATLSNNNLDSIRMLENKPIIRGVIQASNIATASSVAWARVEGEEHHIVDVLAGAAIGRLLTSTIHNTWIKQYKDRSSFNIIPQKGGAVISFSWRH